MPQVYFKPITWYTEMHHVRTFFSVWRLGFFTLHDVHSQRVYLQEESLPNCQRGRCLSAEDKIWLGQIRSSFLDAFDTIKRAVSFPLEDKHFVNEHHVIRKSHDATQKNMSSCGAFQCTTWLVWNKLAASKTLLWRRQKNSWVSRSTWKSNSKFHRPIHGRFFY